MIGAIAIQDFRENNEGENMFNQEALKKLIRQFKSEVHQCLIY